MRAARHYCAARTIGAARAAAPAHPSRSPQCDAAHSPTPPIRRSRTYQQLHSLHTGVGLCCTAYRGERVCALHKHLWSSGYDVSPTC